jgi:CO/xanthine dehydrogenase Mo-binding subunit
MHQTFYFDGKSVVRFNVNKNTYQKVSYTSDIDGVLKGCITMGLGYVLREEIRFKGGKILDENFDTYELPRFSWLPKIETVLVDNPAMPPQGCGEPAITPMGAVIANAVYDAIGVRLYELPMTPARIKKAIIKQSG